MLTKAVHTETVAEFITHQIRISGKSQVEIASELGYPKPNIITMFKQGKTRIPLDKVGPLAKALEIDPALLLKKVMSDRHIGGPAGRFGRLATNAERAGADRCLPSGRQR